MIARKYQRGDRIRVLAHETTVCGVKIFRETFIGEYIKDYESGGIVYVELYGEGSYPGHRVVPKEFVVPIEEDQKEAKVEFDGEFYILTCACGKLRRLKPQHANQVKRCAECQKEHDKKTARERYKRRRK